MKIYSPDIVSSVKHQDTKQGASTQIVLHDHANKPILDQFSIAEDGSLQFGGTDVGAALDNADVVSKLGVSNGLLTFDGQPVDTVGQTFLNAAILDKFSVVDGVLLFDGALIDTTSHQFANLTTLEGLGVDASGALTLNGVSVAAGDPSALHSYTSAAFSVDAGATVTVPHVAVSDASTIDYTVESLTSMGAVSKPDRYLTDSISTALNVDTQSMTSSFVRLSNSYTSASGPVVEAASVASMNYSFSYVVDSNIYLVNCSGRAIYSATTATLPTFTSTGKTFPGTDSLNSGTGAGVVRCGDMLYYFSSTYIYSANVSDPATWTSTGFTNPNQAGALFVIGQTIWLIGGATSARAILYADVSNLGSWTTSPKLFPATNGLNQNSSYQYKNRLYTITTNSTVNSIGNAIYRAEASDPTTWTQIGTFPHNDWRMGIAAVVNGAVICASGYYSAVSVFESTKEVYIAPADNPASWTALTSMPNATHGAAKFVVGNKLYILDGASLVSYTVTPSVAAGSTGVLTLAPLDLTNVNPIVDVVVHAVIPANTNVIAAISLDDGLTWKYWSTATLTWQTAASQSIAFELGASLSLMAGTTQYRVPGLSNYDAGTATSLTIALRLAAVTANVTPCVNSVIYTYAGALSVSPMVTGPMTSAKAEVGLQYADGAINSVQLKNLTASMLLLRLKVQS